tara:strand:- start:788 stop:1147 length:360 start_codon:yes stop_codon:yes gene_type:complete
MAYFAEIGTDNVILRVIVVANQVLVDGDGNEQESLGQAFCRDLLGGTWKQTSYNKTIRKNFASAGYTYDSSKDAFIPPKPYASWGLNDSTCLWEAPISYPSDGKKYKWVESSTSWELVD